MTVETHRCSNCDNHNTRFSNNNYFSHNNCGDNSGAITAATPIKNEVVTMQLGNFSISLAVKDIAVSLAFYQKLGFTIIGGDQQQNWLVLKNGNTKIGLFQEMFEGNILTFNPGWDDSANTLTDFTDVRDLQRELKKHGLPFLSQADETTTGPASFILKDPDGNQILVDQHVDSPA